MRVVLKIFTMMALVTLGAYAFNYNTTLVSSSPDTRGIKKLVIRSNGMIKAVALCRSGRCNLGWTDYVRTENGLLASWKLPGRGHKVVLVEAARHNQARVVIKSLHNDGRRDKTRIKYFRKKHRYGYDLHAYDGDWVNAGKRYKGLGSLRIYHRGNQIMVKAWNQCRQPECSWGRSSAIPAHGKLLAEWNLGRVTRVMTIRGMDRDQLGEFQTLKVKVENNYADGRAGETRIFFLRRRR